MTTMEKPKSANLREYCGWTGNTEDDIVTTGATASECARVLLTAGAKEVLFAAVAAAGTTTSK